MRILITNDDGISAPGLEVMEQIATAIAGDDGEVWTVAPATEQSGVGHCISYLHPTRIAEAGPRRFAVDGTPADCVLAGLHHVLEDSPPDVILSGVNRGNNSAENTLYSGTIGAAMEGALQGVPAIALSQYYGPDNAHLDDSFEAARVHGADVVRRILKAPYDREDYRLFYNVNFPPCPADDVKGTRAVAQGFRKKARFGVEAQTSPTGREFLWVFGGPQREPTQEGTDARVNLEGYISVTPMRADLTSRADLPALDKALT